VAAAAPGGGHLSGRDYAAALAVVVIWGLNFVAMKFALRDFTPFQLGAARYVFAVLPLVLLVKAPRLHWKWVLLYGLCQGVGQFGFLFSALKVGMTAALASVLMQTQVFFTAIFGFVLLHERPSRPLQLGLLLAALGLACFAMNYIAPVGGGAGASPATTFWGLVLNVPAGWARLTVATASPPCAPTPGISSGSVGAMAAHALDFRPGRWRPPPGRAGRSCSTGPAPGAPRARTAAAGRRRWPGAGSADRRRRGWRCGTAKRRPCRGRQVGLTESKPMKGDSVTASAP
jgi:drug/metabolite transporter (DMT)-like permease